MRHGAVRRPGAAQGRAEGAGRARGGGGGRGPGGAGAGRGAGRRLRCAIPAPLSPHAALGCCPRGDSMPASGGGGAAAALQLLFFFFFPRRRLFFFFSPLHAFISCRILAQTVNFAPRCGGGRRWQGCRPAGTSRPSPPAGPLPAAPHLWLRPLPTAEPPPLLLTPRSGGWGGGGGSQPRCDAVFPQGAAGAADGIPQAGPQAEAARRAGKGDGEWVPGGRFAFRELHHAEELRAAPRGCTELTAQPPGAGQCAAGRH